jgi:hypothetical protein
MYKVALSLCAGLPTPHVRRPQVSPDTPPLPLRSPVKQVRAAKNNCGIWPPVLLHCAHAAFPRSLFDILEEAVSD